MPRPIVVPAEKSRASSVSDASTQVGQGEIRVERDFNFDGIPETTPLADATSLDRPHIEYDYPIPSLITVDDSALRMSDESRMIYDKSRFIESDAVTKPKVLWTNPDTIIEPGTLDLDVLLRQCAVSHADSRVRRFWPIQVLEKVLTADRIIHELGGSTTGKISFAKVETTRSLADRIIRNHLRLFAVLTLIGQGRCIGDFVQEGIQDRHLPLISDGPTCHLYQRFPGVDGARAIQSFLGKDWAIFHRELFSDLQYAVSPVVLELQPDGRTPKHMDLDHKEVLPFIEMTDRQDGGYGQISTVKVHPDCHGFHQILSQVRH